MAFMGIARDFRLWGGSTNVLHAFCYDSSR